MESELERQFEDISLNRIRALGEEMIIEAVQVVKFTFSRLTTSLHYILSTEEGGSQFILFVAIITLISFTIAAAKEFAILSITLLRRYLINPRLVREYGNMICIYRGASSLREVVLPLHVKDRVERLCRQIHTGKTKKSPQRNILIHGPAGCGKTMLAKALCHENPHMPFALLCSSDITPLGKNAPLEMQKLLTWARNGTKSKILIIEDAEAIFGTRSQRNHQQNRISNLGGSHLNKSMSYTRDTLNVFLSMTGKACNDFMLILTTSQPHLIDEAILDRIDELVPLSKPGMNERFEILRQEARKFTRYPPQANYSDILGMIMNWSKKATINRGTIIIDDSFDFAKALKNLIVDEPKLDRCSGRQLQKLMQRVASKVYASDKCMLTKDLWEMEIEYFSNELETKAALIYHSNEH